MRKNRSCLVVVVYGIQLSCVIIVDSQTLMTSFIHRNGFMFFFIALFPSEILSQIGAVVAWVTCCLTVHSGVCNQQRLLHALTAIFIFLSAALWNGVFLCMISNIQYVLIFAWTGVCCIVSSCSWHYNSDHHHTFPVFCSMINPWQINHLSLTNCVIEPGDKNVMSSICYSDKSALTFPSSTICTHSNPLSFA